MTKKIILTLLCIISTIVVADITGSLSKEAIDARLQPAGQVNVAGVSNDKVADTGQGGPEKIYQRYCSACHATGFAGAPVRGNKEAWGPRLLQGLDQMTEHSWVGYKGVMPPKGNCTKCTKEEIKATVKLLMDAAK